MYKASKVFLLVVVLPAAWSSLDSGSYFISVCSIEPTVQTRSCECKLVKDQVSKINTHLHHNNEMILTVRGQVGSCEEALRSKDQQIERLQVEVQALQHTSICLQEGNVTERRQLREELATVRGQLVSCEDTKNRLKSSSKQLLTSEKSEY